MYPEFLFRKKEYHFRKAVGLRDVAKICFSAFAVQSIPVWQCPGKHLSVEHGESFVTEGISPYVGITSTPVIDLATGTMYVTSYVHISAGSRYKLHALALQNGAEKFGGPVLVTAQVSGSGLDQVNNVITLAGGHYQRPGLLLLNGIVYLGFGHHDHGWLLGYDAVSLNQVSVFNVSPNGSNGNLWGSSPATEGSSIYFMTANGTFDANIGGLDYGDSFIKLDPMAGAVQDWFSPFDQNNMFINDLDLGSGGVIVLPDNGSSHPHEIVGAGKTGRIYLLDRDNMGHYMALADSQIVQSVDSTGRVFSTPAYWNGHIYFGYQSSSVKAFGYSNGLLTTTPTSISATVFGWHGATPSVSSNGSTDGIVWVLQVDASTTGGPAVLHAYDARDLSVELYNSKQTAADALGPAVKFTVPTVINGKVYVGTANQLDVYGLR